MMRPVWAEIDLEAIRYNCRQVKGLVKQGTEIMAIIKANGYGHGAQEVAKEVLEAGATQLGVATQKEALVLRKAGIAVPILILGFTPSEDVAVSIKNKLAQTVFSLAQGVEIARRAKDLGLKAPVHLKIDTGMGRIGFLPDEKGLADIVRLLELPGLQVEGIYTHLAQADSADKSSARRQLARFDEFLAKLKREGRKLPLIHAANSAAVMELPEAHYDLVRPGIMLYGLYPSEEMRRERVELRPALSWKTRVVHVKEVPPGTPISYSGTYVTGRTTRVATLPLGYADGFRRLLSNRGQVLIHGQRAPVIGRVCMDQTMVDVTDVGPVAVGDLVTLIGRQEQEEITAEEMAGWVGTINYEIVCGISDRVLRKYLPENTSS
ncbi:MAG: alanine racemase [Clostridia bacterium]|nr:alanine racemase [Clostridia bacterium]